MLRNTWCLSSERAWLYDSFYTPFGVRCFGTWSVIVVSVNHSCFYTPFGVRCFGTTLSRTRGARSLRFLYALRREVLRNTFETFWAANTDVEEFLYALRREVLRNHDVECALFVRTFLYALRREVLRNSVAGNRLAIPDSFLYALRREVLRNIDRDPLYGATDLVSIRPSA